MDVTLDQVTEMLVSSFGLSPEDVRAEATLAELDVDSLSMVEFCMMAEKEWDITIGEDELTGEHTVRDVVELLSSKRVPA